MLGGGGEGLCAILLVFKRCSSPRVSVSFPAEGVKTEESREEKKEDGTEKKEDKV